MESTGVFISLYKADFMGRANRVIIFVPSADVSIFCMSMNHEKYDNSLKIVTKVSCTTECLANVISNNFGIIDSRSQSMPSLPPRRLGWPLRTCDAVGKVISELNGKLSGMAFGVPIPKLCPQISSVDCPEKAAKYDDIEKVMKQTLCILLKSILGSTEEPVTPLFYLPCWDWHCPNNHFDEFIFWYDDEFGYSNKVVDLMDHMFSKE
ncbi:LOW QUALITY PROTEIN: Glyceraldehyde-3-phosphate dehydrogenase [Plecturocebus cupreus]